MDGVGADGEPAASTAAGIVDAGGTAVADISDVATVGGAEALIARRSGSSAESTS